MPRDTIVIGGGVSGVTVGIVLRLLNVPTRIICEHWIEDIATNTAWLTTEPRFASQYPAASVISHTVAINDPLWHARCNKCVFDALLPDSRAGLRRQRHYEVFEDSRDCPPDIAEMPEFAAFPADGSGVAGAPRRAATSPIFGWSFQVVFAEMQIYRHYLAQLYRALGGTIEKGRHATLSELTRQGIETIVNCGGAWAPGLLGDSEPSRFVKGSLVRVDVGGMLPRSQATSELVSYNYHPNATIYSNSDGTPADVYFYPRSDGLLLGGTRLESIELDPDALRSSDGFKTWIGERWRGATIDLPQVADPKTREPVPAPIITLNRDLIRTLTGIDVDAYPKAVMTGYRHKRAKARLEQAIQGSTRVVHNYGHGGAGVTLSWSCAIKVASMVLDREIHAGEITELLGSRVPRSL
jgi:glycine/D-amino acid oxidase-like deaminating enzyme